MSLLDYGAENEKPTISGRVRRFASQLTEYLNRPAAPANIRTPDPESTATGIGDTSTSGYNGPIGPGRSDRRRVWRELDEMDKNDELVSTGLDVIADCATGFEPQDDDGFEWKIDKDDEGARKLLAELKSRLELASEVWHITRNFVKQGEEYREIVLNGDGFVQRFKHLPSHEIWPNLDERGNKIPGWEQRRSSGRAGTGIPFDEWQIIPFIYGPREGYHGTGLMSSSRRTWKRLQKLEDGMVLARILRAYDKLKHKIPVKPEWSDVKQQTAIENYKRNMTKKRVLDNDGTLHYLDNPISVETDFFIPDDGTGKGDIIMMTGQNHQLQNIEDVEYHRERLLSRIKVPRHYLNLGSGNRGALTEGGTTREDVQFARTLRQVQAVLRGGLVELASLALFLQGYSAEDLGLKVILAKINTEDVRRDAEVKLNMAKAAELFANIFGGLPAEIVATEYMKLGDTDKNTMIAFLKEAEQRSLSAPEQIVRPAGGLPAAGSAPRNGARGSSLPTNRVDVGTVTVQDLTNALSTLRMLVQAAEERNGVRYGVGEAERKLSIENIIREIGVS